MLMWKIVERSTKSQKLQLYIYIYIYILMHYLSIYKHISIVNPRAWCVGRSPKLGQTCRSRSCLVRVVCFAKILCHDMNSLNAPRIQRLGIDGSCLAKIILLWGIIEKILSIFMELQ